MIESTFVIGAVLTVIVLIVSIILVKVTPAKSYTTYIPGILFFGSGLILLLFSTLFDRIKPFGFEAGLGGWGIACLFAAIISLIVTATLDSFRQTRANA